ncbi:MAG: hypothetical protein WC796_04790 [Candidatus Pacearchaeota archaeon]|jgi:hypothetical protein
MKSSRSVPSIIWPKKPGRYKVVQFYDPEERPYLRFSDLFSGRPASHEETLMKFAIELGVRCINDQVYQAKNLPVRSGYYLCGAGFCRLDPKEKTAVFNKGSSQYDKRINKEHLRKLRLHFPDWQIK